MIRWDIIITSWICSTIAAVAVAYIYKGTGHPPVKKQIDISVDQQIDALLRGHPNSQTVCKVPGEERSYFVRYTKEYSPNGIPINWYYLKDIELLPAGNGTYFITDLLDNQYVVVYPDINGLACKEQINK